MATLSQNVFEASRDEGGISRSTSETTSGGEERLTEELEDQLDEHILAAEFDKRSMASTPDDAEDQFKTQASTQKQASTLDPALPSTNPRLPSLSGMSNPMFCLKDLAFTKIIVHGLKYPLKTINGLLLGQYSAPGAFDIVDAVPLQHYRGNLSPGRIGEDIHTMDLGLGMVRSSFPRLLLSVALN